MRRSQIHPWVEVLHPAAWYEYVPKILTRKDTLHISIDVTSNGQLQLPPYPDDSPSGFHNITIFLSSYVTGRNFTVTNGTATENDSTLGDIMLQEEGSTVKHVSWLWPACLVGNGAPSNSDSDRGLYNVSPPGHRIGNLGPRANKTMQISIRQNFRLNGSDQYTIFDLPIQITNSISENGNRSSCDSLNNPLLTEEDLRASANNFTRLVGSAIETKGAAAGLVTVRMGAMGVWVGLLVVFFSL